MEFMRIVVNERLKVKSESLFSYQSGKLQYSQVQQSTVAETGVRRSTW